MTQDRDPREGLAWARVQTPGPRGHYQHQTAYKRRESKRDSFRRKIRRNPATGCWEWLGSTVTGAGRHPYPIFNHRRETTPDNTTRAAFHWMMREWFPDTTLPNYARTDTVCGNTLCLNPFHRFIDPDAKTKSNPRMDHRRVLDIYSWRGRMAAKATAEMFGCSVSTVERIWNGNRWSAVTGQRRDGRTPPMNADRARAIYADRDSGLTQQAAAEKHKTSRITVRSIWYGMSWSAVTGAKRVQPEPRQLSEPVRAIILERCGKQSAYSLAQELGVGKTTILATWRRASLLQQQTPC